MHDEKTETRKVSYFGDEARSKLLKGVDAVADAVRVTMGAKGRTVLTSYGHATKDGVTVARDVEVNDDPAAHRGAMLVKAASVRTCDVAGDGTTATCVLAQALIHGGMRLISEGKDAQDIRREIEAALPTVISALEAQSKPVTDVGQIAAVSANDPEIGSIVAEAINAVGADGLVTVENTYGERSVEVADGMQFDKGVFLSSFLTDPARRKCAYDDVTVLVYSGKIHDQVGLAKALESTAKEGKAILVVADDYEIPVLRSLELSKVQGGVRILAVKAPMIHHDDALKDIAVYSGATVVTEADGFKNFKAEWLGHVKSVVSTPDRTVLRCDDGREEAIKARVEEIYEAAKQFTDAERRNHEKRASRLMGKIAVIRLPATTEEEGRELRDRVEDAIFASQAALEAGTVPGGGYAFLAASKSLLNDTREITSDGASVLYRALLAPLRRIARNAGKNDAEVLARCKAENKGYNVLTDAFEDLAETGIVDPLKVCVTALRNAASVAVLALTTEVVICEEKVK